MKQITCTLLIFLCVLLTTSYAQKKFPDQWRPGMTFTLYEGPGMQPYWSKIIISDTACWYIEQNDGPLVQTKFKLNAQQLAKLLKVLSDNDLKEMKKHQVPAYWYDRATTSIYLVADGEYFGGSESHAQDLEKGWDEKFDRIRIYVSGIAGRK